MIGFPKHEASLIAGRWTTGREWIEVENPATEAVIGRVPHLGQEETVAAIAAAENAMKEWSSRTAGQRAVALRRLFDLMTAHQDDLAVLLTEEQGKPLTEAKGEIAYAASYFEWFAEEAKRVYGDVIPGYTLDKRILVLKQPVGVVAAITPWNFPAAMVTRKVAPALAAGCGVVVKPALQTPFTALAIGALAIEAGLPDGLLNVVTGSAIEIGRALTENPLVRKLSFTGSTEVGAKLYAQCAPTIKKLSLELGGNAPFIVFDDANIDLAIEGAMQSKFRNAGQTCVCANRFYVQRGVYHEFIDKLTSATRLLSVGPGIEEGSQIGPLIDQRAVRKIRDHINDALERGGKLVVGGEPHERGGRFFQPTIVADVTQDMLVTREETFGPLAAVMPFDLEEDAISLANETEFGLAAYVYATNLGRVWRVFERIEAGIIGVNTGSISTAVAPFGGIKMSGLGREGSRYGIEDYLETKYVCLSIY